MVALEGLLIDLGVTHGIPVGRDGPRAQSLLHHLPGLDVLDPLVVGKWLIDTVLWIALILHGRVACLIELIHFNFVNIIIYSVQKCCGNSPD